MKNIAEMMMSQASEIFRTYDTLINELEHYNEFSKERDMVSKTEYRRVARLIARAKQISR